MEADTANEAMELYRALSGVTNGHQPSTSAAPAHTPTPTPAAAPVTVPQQPAYFRPGPLPTQLGDFARATVKLLASKPFGERTEVVAETIGLIGNNKTKGLAAVTRQIREWGKSKFGLDYETGSIRREKRLVNGGWSTHHVLCAPLMEKIRGREKELLG